MKSGHIGWKRKRHLSDAFALYLLLLSAFSLLFYTPDAYGAKRYSLRSFTPRYMGQVVDDEPLAQKVGQDILQRGGNAIDAAVAASFALSVTLPSRASLGGGGACIVWHPHDTTATAFVFPARPAIATDTSADRPAGIPTMARGLYIMHQRFGHINFTELVRPAQRMSIEGIAVGSLLYTDLLTVHSALFADPKARDIFTRPDGQMVGHNDMLFQKDLHGVLTHIVYNGVASLYNGALSHAFVEQARQAGAGITVEDMRNNSFPDIGPTLDVTSQGISGSFLPPPEDGGLATAYSWLSGRKATDIIFPWRLHMAQGGDGSLAQGKAFLDHYVSTPPNQNNFMPQLPASTALVTADRFGNAVSCGFSLNNLFGTGRVAGETGLILAASPTRRPQPLFPLVIMHNGSKELLAVVSASGQNEAADEAVNAMRFVQSPQMGDVHLIRGQGWADEIDCFKHGKANDKCTRGMLSIN